MAIGNFLCIENYGNERFLVDDVIKGGMGVVFRLQPVNPLFPTMAMKTLQASADHKQFLSECEVWLRLSDHPGIAKARWYGEWMRQSAVLADWYDGTLAQFPLRELGTTDISSFLSAVVDALRCANERFGVIHQDIKPANILVDRAGHPRVADFGIARAIRSRLAAQLTARAVDQRTQINGSVAGTPYFMAPELLFGSAKPSVATDVFSYGITFLVSLTNFHPYITGRGTYSTTPNADLLRMLDSMAESLPQGLSGALLKCVAIDPSKRPNSWGQVLSLLHARPLRKNPATTNVDADAIIAQVQFYRSQQDYPTVFAILRESLSRSPSDAAILNALGVSQLQAKQFADAQRTFERAADVLTESRGIRNGRLYLDPLVNLGRLHIEIGRFASAACVLNLGRQWIAESSPIADSHQTDRHYAEFAWLDLWNGHFSDAYRRLVSIAEMRETDATWLKWASLALLSSQSEQHNLRQLLQTAGTVPIQDLTAALAVSALSSLVGIDEGTRLRRRIPNQLRSMIREVEQNHVMQTDWLFPPGDDFARRVILAALDGEITGGRTHGLV